MFGKKKKYNHNKKNVYKAVGVDKKEFRKKVKQLNDYLDKVLSDNNVVSQSKVIEYIENKFTKRELSLLSYSLCYELSKDIEKDDVPHPEFG